jgi:hypothetical protein
MANLLSAKRHAANNQAEVEASTVCGCFYCLQTFPPNDIVAWGGLDVADFNNPDAASAGTALCPRCGNDSVIGDKSGYRIDADFLSQMYSAWFQKTIIRKPTPKT